ncbi:hypothetical protein UPYG_G00256610 [Umbra pygmaea]|uniref:Uronyl 2-sulfotransferase n=1 Tax=Umbra pygmaea TaxID=75934 RepID=A0ABD0WYM0_UMBPY
MMKKTSNSPFHNIQTPNHIRDRNNKKFGYFSVVPFRFSLRGYRFCLAALFLFCFGSLFYQLNRGPPKILLDIRLYLGQSTYLDDHGPPTPRVLPFPSQVIYNRVGKCGSRTVVILLRLLAERHQFNLLSSDIHNKTRLTKHEQVDLMKNISNVPQPFLYTRHVHFLNFTRFRIEQPVYINIIRDPINRFLSNYFFRRFGDWRGEQNHLIRTPGMKDDERYLGHQCVHPGELPRMHQPQTFLYYPVFLWTAPPVQGAGSMGSGESQTECSRKLSHSWDSRGAGRCAASSRETFTSLLY